MINHKLLIKKLQHYGDRGIVLDWFISLLSNRSEFVKIQDSSSDLLNITCEVPQGSILGYLLFIVYINDIINASTLATVILFANDTSILFKDKHLKTLYDTFNDELHKITHWFKLNKLSLIIKRLITFGLGLDTSYSKTLVYVLR